MSPLRRVSYSLWAGCLAAMFSARADTNVFLTQFETAEGYNASQGLAGQKGWLSDGAGGNGLQSFIPSSGLQAYIGYTPPTGGYDYLVLWRPINFAPLSAGLPVVKFSVRLGISDSTNDEYDNFRWSLYNSQGDRLFSLDFDNYYTDISYILDGTNQLVTTGVRWTNGVTYDLSVVMNFASNRWSAYLDNRVITTNQPLTTTAAPLNFGDMDAVWLVFSTNTPGDNFMVFDDYRVTAAPLQPAAPRLLLLGKTASQASLRLTGDSGWRFAIDTSSNLTQWTALKTNTLTDGSFDYIDTAAGGVTRRFYRARFVP